MVEDPNEELSDTERKVGIVLANLFENWDEVLPEDGSNKLNKSTILFYLRENTMLSTKELRDNMKKYKFVYYDLTKLMVNE